MKTPYVSRDNSIILEFTKSRGVGLKPSNDRLKGIVEYKVDKNDSITEPFIAQWKEKNRVYMIRSKSIVAHVGPRHLIEVNINATKMLLYNKPKHPEKRQANLVEHSK